MAVLRRGSRSGTALFGPRPVWLYLVLTFALSWAAWGIVLVQGVGYLTVTTLPFFVFASFGPWVAAVVMRRWASPGHTPDAAGVRDRRAALIGLPAAFVLGVVGALVAAGGTFAVGEAGVDLVQGGAALSSYGLPVFFLVVTLVMGPLSEEPGWRGYLYPRLRQVGGIGRIGLVFGPVWALWHLPLFFIPGTYQQSVGVFTEGGLLFLLSTMALTVMISFTFEHLGGLPAAIVVHFGSNGADPLLGLTSQAANAWETGAKVVLAVALVLAHRAIMARRTAGHR